MNNRTLFLSTGLLFVGALASAQTGDTATYSNVELISVDPAQRTIVIRSANGRRQTLVMDDLLAGTGSVKPGDQVIVTVRGGTGIRRVSAISKTSPSLTGVVAAGPRPATSTTMTTTTTTTRRSTELETKQATVRESFAAQVALLSQNARSVDAMWANFVTSCNVKPVSANDGREWFGLWDGRVQADYSGGQCREQFNQLIASGEVIKRGMASAEEVANKVLTPGEIRDIRKLSLMDWDGWSLAPPPKREP